MLSLLCYLHQMKEPIALGRIDADHIMCNHTEPNFVNSCFKLIGVEAVHSNKIEDY